MNKLRGSLYGFIVGDALGVPVEFYSRERLLEIPITDMVGNKQRGTFPGYWSDDTAMSLCTIKSIIENKDIVYKDIMDKFSLWIKEGYLTANDACFGIGQRTLKALTFYNRELKNPDLTKEFAENEWIPLVGKLSEGQHEKMTAGNGSLMRLLPISLYLLNSSKTIKEKITIMSNISSLTHANEECISACIYYMFLIEHLFRTNNILESMKLANDDFAKNYKLYGNFERIINNDFLNIDLSLVKSSGYVIDTLEASLWCFCNSSNYKEAVLKAVSLGGDTDTVAAITGSLAGIYYGYENIPSNWIDSLMKKQLLDDLINEFLMIII